MGVEAFVTGGPQTWAGDSDEEWKGTAEEAEKDFGFDVALWVRRIFISFLLKLTLDNLLGIFLMHLHKNWVLNTSFKE